MRIDGRGLIDRDATVRFTLRRAAADTGFAGDTLASALLANGVRLVGAVVQVPPPARHPDRRVARSRTRWSRVRRGARRQEPNVRATVQELYEGLAAREPEPLAVAATGTLLAVNDLARAVPGGGLLLQDLHVAAGLLGEGSTSR